MSWLRVVSIATFKKFNPTWEIRLHDTPPEIRAYGLQYGQEADWTWWMTLANHGGFQVATDIVFLKPIPDEWLDCGLNACLNGSQRIWQFAMLGAEPEHPAMMASDLGCAAIAEGGRVLDYQAMGVWMLQKSCKGLLQAKGKFYDQPMSALCHFTHAQADFLWSDSGLHKLPDSTVGVHWYGGAPESKESESGPGHPSYIIRLAESVFP